MSDPTIFSPLRGVAMTLLDAASALNASGFTIAIPDSFKYHKLYIIGSAGVASGAVQPESADASDYAGTWAQIGGGPITVVASTELQVDFVGVYQFIRVRISTVLAGGTVTVKYEGS